jgi:hypothetical protein
MTRKRIEPTKKSVIPYEQSRFNVEHDYAAAPAAPKFRLIGADVLLHVTKARDLEELLRWRGPEKLGTRGTNTIRK